MELLANVLPADILAYANQVPNPENFLLTSEIVPETEINNVKYRIKRRERRINTAKFRAYDTETPFGRREVSHSVTEGLLPPLGQAFIINELETILLSIARGADDEDLIDALYDDIEAHILGIKSRLELAAGDLLEDGVFSLVDENGLTIEADFGVDALNLPTATIKWDQTGAKPLDDERAWINHLIATGSGKPGDALSSSAVVSMLAQNDQYKQSFYGDITTTTGRPTLQPGQVQSVRDSNRLPPIREYDTQVRVDGVNTRVLAEEKFILLPSNKQEFAETQYGITAEKLALSRSGNPRIEREDLPGIIVTKFESDNPVRVGTKSNAVAMPVLYAPEDFVSATVLT